MGIEPTSPAWKAGTLPLSYSRRRRLGTNIPEAFGKSQGRGRRPEGGPATKPGRWNLCALRTPLLLSKCPAQRHFGAGALQKRDQRPPDLRFGRKLTEVHPPDAPGRDIADKKRPSGEPSVSQHGDQFVGRAAGRAGIDERVGAVTVGGRRRRLIQAVLEGQPAPPLRHGKPVIILGTDVQPAGAEQTLLVFKIDEIPAGVALPPFLRALEAPLAGIAYLSNWYVQQIARSVSRPIRWAGRLPLGRRRSPQRRPLPCYMP
jgi:hypothetical protein